MFWIRKANFKEKKGYLYLRETIYERDRRTLKRIPKKNGDGSATKERGKYSKKKDIYCGKIREAEPKHLITFNSYMEKVHEDFLEYKMNRSFDGIIDDFINYLLYIHEIDKEEFFDKKKKVVYYIGNGFLSKETIDYLKRFNLRNESENELERFSNRCQDIGIYDEDIIGTLYMKLSEQNNILSKTEIEVNPKIEKKEYNKYRDFMKEQYE